MRAMRRWMVAASVAALLQACGGGGSSNEDLQGPSPHQPEQSTDGPLKVTTTLAPGVTKLDASWDSKVSLVSADTLEFTAAPPVVTGQVFVVGNRAYKATGVATSAPFRVTVSEPLLTEVYASIRLDGEMTLDERTFVPNTALVNVATASGDTPGAGRRARALLAEPAAADDATTGTFIDKGFHIDGKMALGNGWALEGGISAGVTVVADAYELLARTGKLVVTLDASAEAALTASSQGSLGPAENSACTSATGSTFPNTRVRLGNIPIALPRVSPMQMPVCLSVKVDASTKGELFKVSGGSRAVFTDDQGTFAFTEGGARRFIVESPPRNAMIDNDLRVSTGGQAEIGATLLLEFGLEASALQRAQLGFNLAAGVRSTYSIKYQLGADFAGTYGDLESSTYACGTLKVNAIGELVGHAGFRSVGTVARKLGQYETLLAQRNVGVGCGELEVDPTRLALTSGDAIQVRVFTTDAAGQQVRVPSLSWVSSNPAVAAVNATGLVTSYAAGDATITATHTLSQKSVSVPVSVTSPVVVTDCRYVANSATYQILECMDGDKIDFRESILSQEPRSVTYLHSITEMTDGKTVATLSGNVDNGVFSMLEKSTFDTYGSTLIAARRDRFSAALTVNTYFDKVLADGVPDDGSPRKLQTTVTVTCGFRGGVFQSGLKQSRRFDETGGLVFSNNESVNETACVTIDSVNTVNAIDHTRYPLYRAWGR